MGKETKHIIDINGKRYDAATGNFIGASPAQVKSATVYGAQSVRPAHAGSIDGFRRVSRSAPVAMAAIPVVKNHSAHTVSAPQHTSKSTTSHATNAARKAHSPASHVAPHTPQRAKTLMRSAVTKPQIQSPSVIKAQTRTDLLATIPAQTVAPKMSYNTVNHVRNQRAERMIKSPSVSRYARPTENAVYALGAQSQQSSRPTPRYRGQTTGGTSMSEVRAVTPARVPSAAAARPTHQARPSTNKPDIFEQALADARSHEESYNVPHKNSKKRRNPFKLAAAAVAVIAIGSFAAYASTPNLSLKIASYKAGLHVSLPSQQPSGFQLGYLDYQPGNVKVNFTSPADSRQFNITQKSSSWDSQALLNNFVSSASTAYETYSRAGRTVYLLGNNTATWVDSGIWYTVDGNSSLSSKQVLDLASSM